MSIPFVKSFPFEYGVVDQMSPLVRRVICNNPGPFTYTGSGTYLVGRDELAVIDPGPADDAHLQAILKAADGAPITRILVTHTHKDHCGGVPALKAATGAEVLAYGAHPETGMGHAPALDEGSDLDFTPDTEVDHGSIIRTPEWSIEAVHTPGHISNHLCFALAEEKTLFTGDHIMGWATTVVAFPDGDMADYFDSLDLLAGRSDLRYLPTHGAPIEQPQDFVRAVKVHREMRDQQIMAELEKGASQIMEMVSRIYAEVDDSLHIAAALNVQAHLDRHVKQGRVIQEGEKLLEARYWFA